MDSREVGTVGQLELQRRERQRIKPNEATGGIIRAKLRLTKKLSAARDCSRYSSWWEIFEEPGWKGPR